MDSKVTAAGVRANTEITATVVRRGEDGDTDVERFEKDGNRSMTLRLPKELRERLGDIAKKNHRSVHGQIIAMLEEAAEREEGKKK